MVEFIGNLGQNATKGEKKFHSQVSSCFQDVNDIFCYIEPPLGSYRPDFLLISPKLGAIIVEIKDYSPNRLKFVGATGNWVKFDIREDIPISNPYDQIYQYWRSVKNKINHSRSLEKLNIQVSQLVIFSQIDENSKIGNEIKNCKPEKVQICFNDTLKSQNKIKAFFQDLIPINFQMNPKDFDLFRSNLIPSCRLPELQQKSLLEWLEHSDQVKLLDLEQEKMAHDLGEGHRIFYGVAGSGKTVLLVARARFLGRKYPKWRILVLCYNRILGVALRQMINPQDYPADIEVDNFHAWARKYIKNSGSIFSRIYDEGWTKAKRSNRLDDFFKIFVPELVLEVNKEFGYKYDAILIDEGQDFESIWYTAVMDCLNDVTSSLLISLEGLQ